MTQVIKFIYKIKKIISIIIMSNNNLDYILHPNKEKILEHFFEGPRGYEGESGPKGLRGDRGSRGSVGSAGPPGPPGNGLTEADMLAKSFWCVRDNDCQTPKNVAARFRDDSYLRIGPNSFGDKALVLGGRDNKTGESALYTTYGDIYLDSANADEDDSEPGSIYIGKNSKGNTYINEYGDSTLINDKSGFLGVNMQGTKPENLVHIKGDRALTIENTSSTGASGIIFKDPISTTPQDHTVGVTDYGLYLRDNNNEKVSLTSIDGSIGIGTTTPNTNYTLDVEGQGRFRRDLRLTGGTDASVQINFNDEAKIGERNEFTDINQGLELIGGDTGKSKVQFFGKELNINHGPSNTKTIEFNQNDVKFPIQNTFDGPASFNSQITEEEQASNPDNIYYGLTTNCRSKFNQPEDHTESNWMIDATNEWVKISSSNGIETNAGINFYSAKSDAFEDSTNIYYDHTKAINDGDQINGENLSKGAMIFPSNLIVEGKGNGTLSGIETSQIRCAGIDVNEIRTYNAISYSDKNIKKNIKSINQKDNMNKLLKIKGYDYQNKITNKKDKGLLAQEIEKILPDIVDSSGKYKGIKYDNLIPMLIEGIKYQQKEIEMLKKKLNV